MSVKVMGMVWDADLARDEKYILLAYADHADHEGRNVFPSIMRIARKTGYTTRSVQLITKKLIEMGILIPTGVGPKRTNRYIISLAKLREKHHEYPFKDVCAHCGSNFPILHKHHIIPISEGGTDEITNLVQLCPNCHALEHARLEGEEISPSTEISINDDEQNEEKGEEISPDPSLTVIEPPKPPRDFLDDVFDHASRQQGGDSRPKGWQGATEAEYAICQRVADLWAGGRLPSGTWGDRIEKQLAGADELLSYHGGDLQATLLTIDRYHEHYQDNGSAFSIVGPQSLVDVVRSFMAQNENQRVIRISA